MKVLIVRDYLVPGGGGCTAIMWLANNIKRDVTVKFVFTYKDQVEKKLIEDFDVAYLENESKNGRISRFLDLYTRDFFRLYKLINKEKPDVVISYGTTSLTIVALCRLLLHFKLVISERRDPGWNKTISDRLRYKLYNFADKLVFQTEAVKQYFGDNIKNKVVVIPNPITIPSLHWQEEKSDFSIVHVGRMEVVQKRQDLILLSFKTLLTKYPNLKLFFLGDGSDLNIVKLKARDLGILESVIFCGYVKDVQEELLKHKIFVLASDYEGIPNALLEAMALGMPVVSTDCSPGGAALLLGKNENGILIPCNDHLAMSDAIDKMLSNKEMRKKYSEAARKSVGKFSPEKIKGMWLDVIM